jgi:DNA-directed RNA polymerase specialized sigma24 family protein
MTHVATVPDWLAADQSWLTEQPGGNPWPDAAARILARLDAWADHYARELGTARPPGDDTPRGLWACWAHHWRTAVEVAGKPVDGSDVAAEIERGAGRRGRGQLGGNVICDVVLARAMLHHDNPAIARFEADYKDGIVRQVVAVRRFARGDQDWWNELLAELVGAARKDRPGRLTRYNGRSGLVPWVVTVAVRFLCDRKGDKPYTGIAEETVTAPATSPGLEVLSAECLDLLARRVRVALDGLEARQKLVLKMAYVDRMSGQKIAGLLRVHPGHLTRLRQDALLSLQHTLAGRPGDAEAISDCLRDLFAGGQRRDLADALFEVLRTAGTEGQP